MASASSNLKSVADWMREILDAVDCSEPATAGAIAAPIRKGIAGRAAQLSGADAAWAANIGHYGEEKANRGLPVGTGLADDHPRMLDADQMAGEILEPGRGGFKLAYGVDPEVKMRGQCFHNGSDASDDGTASSAAKNQVARPFWEATDADEQAVCDAMRALIEKKL